MIITWKNFTLESSNNLLFDLKETISAEKHKKINKKLVATGEIVDKEVLHGYGMQLETCIKIMINETVSKKFGKLELKQYLQEYKTVKNEILNCLK
jgi:hypothetical protein